MNIPDHDEREREPKVDLDSMQREVEELRSEVKSEREYSESLAKNICKMEDVLGFKNDCHDKDGAFIPTIGPWLERVRDLIAKEGELGDARTALKKAKVALLEWEALHIHIETRNAVRPCSHSVAIAAIKECGL